MRSPFPNVLRSIMCAREGKVSGGADADGEWYVAEKWTVGTPVPTNGVVGEVLLGISAKFCYCIF